MDPRSAKRIVFFTGAGISAESGLPTYRGAGGIWDEYDWQDVACQRAFDRDPQRVWDFQNRRRRLYQASHPSPGHLRIAALEVALPGTVTVVTQNIDGLHQAAGSRDVVELHGNLWRVRCPNPACPRHGPAWEIGRDEATDGRCACGGWLRPDIVWFEDALDPVVLSDAVQVCHTAELLVSIGTSGVVWPAAELPQEAKRAGAHLVEINPEPTPLTPWVDQHLACGAAEGLDRLFGAA